MKRKAVIFDLFGTLIRNLDKAEFEQVLSEMALALSVPSAGFIRLWNESWDQRRIGFFKSLAADIEHLCQVLGHNPIVEEIAKAIVIRKNFTTGALNQTRAEAVGTLAGLAGSGYEIGLISNCAGDVPLVWSTSVLAQFVKKPTFSCSVGLKKPDKEIYLLTCKELEVEPRNCFYIADGNEDELTGALEAGLKPILFSGPDIDPYDEGHGRKTWKGHTIRSLDEIPDLLTKAEV